MINTQLLNELKPIISDPAWDIVVRRLEYIRDQADKDLHSATIDTFLEKKGAFIMADRICKLFGEPRNLADDGVRKFESP